MILLTLFLFGLYEVLMWIPFSSIAVWLMGAGERCVYQREIKTLRSV